MKRMLLAPLFLLAAACGSTGGDDAGVRMTEDDFETKIASAIAFDASLLKTGDRVVYFVKRKGESQSQKYSWAAVSEEPNAVWIENKVPLDPRPMVVKTKVERSGKVLEQWIGEPGGVPGKTYPSSKSADGPAPIRDTSTAKADSKEEVDRITVGGKTWDCTRVTTNLAYPDGRKSTMINWFSKEVPFAASKALGGLVKRQFGKLTMELVVGDHSGQSEMLIPAPQK
ncbi:MAG TPA: hypothetical protein VM222_03410 [Planctomycetota bacterium]|nr:hypothetical protein [Planctomycetota bacterium]